MLQARLSLPVGKAARTRVRLQVSVLTSVLWLVLGMFVMVALEGATQPHMRDTPTCTFAFAVGVLTAHWLRCAVLIARWPPFQTDWTYIDAFYFCVITLTTVGLGDFVPETGPGIKFAYFYCMVSCTKFGCAGAHGWLAPVLMVDR